MLVSKKEITKNIKKEIMSLNINSTFQENPAFDTDIILKDLHNSILFDSQLDNINIEKSKNKININYDSSNGKTSFEIVRLPSNDNSLYIKKREDVKEDKNFETVNYTLTKINLEGSNIHVSSKNAYISSIGNENYFFEEEKEEIYNSYGIEILRTLKEYKKANLNLKSLFSLEDYKDENINQLIAGQIDNNLDIFVEIKRKGIDTARVKAIEDVEGEKKLKYNTELLLNNKYDLQEMNIDSPKYSTTSYIDTLEQEEISSLISKSDDVKVQEGLRRWNNEIYDRSINSYDPSDDLELKVTGRKIK